MVMLRSCVHASQRRTLATAVPKSSRKEGDISDVFVSLSGARRAPLPDRFRQLKCDLVRGRERQLTDSWRRLLRDLERENEVIANKGSQVVPQVDYADLERGLGGLRDEIKKRGAVVVRGVVPEAEARAYKEEVEDYVKKNPWTRGTQTDLVALYERKKALGVLLPWCEHVLISWQHFRPTTPKSTSSTGRRRSSKRARTPILCACSSS